ncbi:hypothetical protein An12g09030 [Aspergillus niger]|uniref:Uncharacterized protein n=2 Tax=Aspergillus niger TaxID=5061 RepID=A2R0L6_ASPNC|nr:hypothetical protein An12g09030 [Aspergillus niger]CAK46390.1 hypothetical protein An12g09030 [Aspergillus niger]
MTVGGMSVLGILRSNGAPPQSFLSGQGTEIRKARKRKKGKKREKEGEVSSGGGGQVAKEASSSTCNIILGLPLGCEMEREGKENKKVKDKR